MDLTSVCPSQRSLSRQSSRANKHSARTLLACVSRGRLSGSFSCNGVVRSSAPCKPLHSLNGHLQVTLFCRTSEPPSSPACLPGHLQMSHLNSPPLLASGYGTECGPCSAPDPLRLSIPTRFTPSPSNVCECVCGVIVSFRRPLCLRFVFLRERCRLSRGLRRLTRG